MRDQLLALPKTELIAMFCTLNGGTAGFDHERTKKTECVDRLLSMYTEATIPPALLS